MFVLYNIFNSWRKVLFWFLIELMSCFLVVLLFMFGIFGMKIRVVFWMYVWFFKIYIFFWKFFVSSMEYIIIVFCFLLKVFCKSEMNWWFYEISMMFLEFDCFVGLVILVWV